MDYLMTFDVGTTNAKAVLTDLSGNVICHNTEPMNVYYPQPHYVEQKPDEWWQAVTFGSRRVLEKAGVHPKDVAGVAFSSQAMSVTLVDSRGDLLMPASMIWMDNRAGKEANILMGKLGGPKIFEKLIGAKLTGNYPLSKYLWVKRNVPDLYRRVRAFLDQGAYLCLRATGEWICEWTHASCTGLLDLKTKQWNNMIMKLFGLDAGKFMRPVKSTERIGGLLAQAAGEMGLLEGTPVFGGAVDAMAAAVGAGLVSTGEGLLILGTAGNLGILTDKRIKGKGGLATAQSGDPAKLFYAGSNNASASCMNWVAQNLYGDLGNSPEAFSRIGEDINRVPAGADGLLFAPWLAGERSPYPDDSLRGCLLNLRIDHTRDHIIRAVGEGIAFNFAIVADMIEEACGAAVPSLRVVGGGARYLAWMQIFADVMNRRIEVVHNPSFAGTVGAALIEAVGLGMYPSVEEAARVIKVDHYFEPNAENRSVYRKSREAYGQIYPAVSRLYHQWNPSPAD
jgi:xylulokinase